MATIQDLIVALETKASRATFVALETLTDARARKTGNPHPKILKRSRIQVVIGHRYENSVNNQRAREGKEADFEASPRNGGIGSRERHSLSMRVGFIWNAVCSEAWSMGMRLPKVRPSLRMRFSRSSPKSVATPRIRGLKRRLSSETTPWNQSRPLPSTAKS